MKINSKFSRLFVSSIFLLAPLQGCTGAASPVAVGGGLGVAAGAGAGALVGTLLSRGDVAASALLGGAIGLPVGLALGYAWKQQAEESAEKAKIAQYIKNQDQIMEQEREIEILREDVLKDTPRSLPDEDLKEYQFLGASLGNPYR